MAFTKQEKNYVRQRIRELGLEPTLVSMIDRLLNAVDAEPAPVALPEAPPPVPPEPAPAKEEA